MGGATRDLRTVVHSEIRGSRVHNVAREREGPAWRRQRGRARRCHGDCGGRWRRRERGSEVTKRTRWFRISATEDPSKKLGNNNKTVCLGGKKRTGIYLVGCTPLTDRRLPLDDLDLSGRIVSI